MLGNRKFRLSEGISTPTPPPPSLRPHLNWPVMCGHTSAGKPPSKSGCTGCMCTLVAGNSTISLARSEEQINFSQQSLKMLKMASESFRCCSLVFFSNFPVGCPCTNKESIHSNFSGSVRNLCAHLFTKLLQLFYKRAC